MNRELGIFAIVVGGVALVMGILVLVIPTPSVGLGIGFLVVGVPLTVFGIWAAATKPSMESQRPSAPTQPTNPRPKSKFQQILEGLSIFSFFH